MIKSVTDAAWFRRIALGSFLCAYLVFGLYNEITFITQRPIPESLFQDFRHYERAMADALQGKSPYALRELGPGYLYPPPSLLIVEIFNSIESFPFKVSLYTTLNVALMALMTHGVAKYYGYSFDQTWYWYVICMVFAPFLEMLQLGQINMIALFGIFILFAYTESFYFLGGAGLSLAILTKVSPCLFLIYLFANVKWKTIVAAIFSALALIGLSALRYGIAPIVEYPSFLTWLTNQFILDTNSQSFVSKIVVLRSLLGQAFPERSFPLLSFFADHYEITHLFLTLYILCVILLSGLFFVRGNRDEKEPFFIVTALGMTLLPNVIWYHHYIFLLLPALVWMGWSRFEWRVTSWCLMGLLLIQMDRYFSPYGLSAHAFGHISILALLFRQARRLVRKYAENAPDGLTFKKFIFAASRGVMQ